MVRISLERTASRRVPVSPLDPSTFGAFGQVIQNPSTHNGQPAIESTSANQGTATKYPDITTLSNFYSQSHSRRPGKPVMNFFICQPRQIENTTSNSEGKLFDVKVLERHPFTPQTFIPLGLSKNDSTTRYLIIVAPTLPLKSRSERTAGVKPPYPTPPPRAKRGKLTDTLRGGRPNPFTNDFAPRTTGPLRSTSAGPLPKGPGLPDLDNLQAFIATGDQAVTYGAGTWHAPMVVLGENPIDFVVVQYTNGVATEDCQEVDIRPATGSSGVQVAVERVVSTTNPTIRARL